MRDAEGDSAPLLTRRPTARQAGISNPDAVAAPPLLVAFDLLYRDGRDLTGRPLRDRRARLEEVLAGSELVVPVRRLAPDGLAAWKQVVERGYEGYVAKDEASAYEGARHDAVAEGEAEGLDGRGGPLAAAGWPAKIVDAM